VSSAGPELICAQSQCAAEKEITKVTFYSGLDCKLCDGVREGELLARQGRTFRGEPQDAAKGNWNEWRPPFE
jgi:hypothetical protein